MRWLWLGIALAIFAVATYSFYQNRSNPDVTGDRNLEVRLEFVPFTPRPEFRDSLSMTLRGDGRVRVIQHRREMFVDAVYEGTLPEADSIGLVARAKQARSEWNLSGKSVSEGRDDSIFMLVVIPAGSSDEKSVFGGSVGAASEKTRALIEDLLRLSKRLNKVPPAEAYVRSVPLFEEELKRIQQNEQRRLLTVTEIPADLQPVLIKSLDNPRDFVPITRSQHDRLNAYKQFVVTNNGFSYRLVLVLPTPNLPD